MLAPLLAPVFSRCDIALSARPLALL